MKVTVFCGARPGQDPEGPRAAYALGRGLAEREHQVIYGGSRDGLMGQVAQGALDHGGHVTGIIPHIIREMEVDHDGLTELQLVDTMFHRKELMIIGVDAFIVLPGGLGTLDELAELGVLTQLGVIHTPTIIVDRDGYWQPLKAMIERMIEDEFLTSLPGLIRWAHDEQDALRILDELRLGH